MPPTTGTANGEATEAADTTEIGENAEAAIEGNAEAAEAETDTTVAEPDSASDSAEAIETDEPIGSAESGRGIAARTVSALSPVRVIATLVVLALAASTAYLGFQWHRQGQADRQASAERSEVLADGRTYAIALSSYDYKDLGANFRTVTANATGSFAKQYKLVSSNLTQLIGKYHAVSKASVIAEAVQSLNGNEAVLLLFVDQQITNTRIKSPQVDSNRMRMTLVRSGGRWLLDNVQLR